LGTGSNEKKKGRAHARKTETTDPGGSEVIVSDTPATEPDEAEVLDLVGGLLAA
jgi:hypothetical protein